MRPDATPAHRWVIGLGANLGDAPRTLNQALAALTSRARARRLKRSSLWRSRPVEAQGPDYVNAVVSFDSALSPAEMLQLASTVETEFGRTRTYRNAPRTLDIDLLLHTGGPINEPDLQLPHPRMHERAFVLAPLLEIDPNCDIPGAGLARLCLERCAAQVIDRIGSFD